MDNEERIKPIIREHDLPRTITVHEAGMQKQLSCAPQVIKENKRGGI